MSFPILSESSYRFSWFVDIDFKQIASIGRGIFALIFRGRRIPGSAKEDEAILSVHRSVLIDAGAFLEPPGCCPVSRKYKIPPSA